MPLTVYGIPTCTTVKKVRAWLDEHGLAHTFVDFRANPPEAARVDRWVAAFGPTKMKNTSGGAFRALGPEKADWDAVRWTKAYKGDPMLIKRPIVEKDGKPWSVGWDEGALGRLAR